MFCAASRLPDILLHIDGVEFWRIEGDPNDDKTKAFSIYVRQIFVAMMHGLARSDRSWYDDLGVLWGYKICAATRIIFHTFAFFYKSKRNANPCMNQKCRAKS
jgi:hypothetical protein